MHLDNSWIWSVVEKKQRWKHTQQAEVQSGQDQPGGTQGSSRPLWWTKPLCMCRWSSHVTSVWCIISMDNMGRKKKQKQNTVCMQCTAVCMFYLSICRYTPYPLWFSFGNLYKLNHLLFEWWHNTHAIQWLKKNTVLS